MILFFFCCSVLFIIPADANPFEKYLKEKGKRIHVHDDEFRDMCEEISPAGYAWHVFDRCSNGNSVILADEEIGCFVEACKHQMCVLKVVVWYDMKLHKGMVVLVDSSPFDGRANLSYGSTQMVHEELSPVFWNNLKKWLIDEELIIAQEEYLMADDYAKSLSLRKVYEKALVLYRSGKAEEAAQMLSWKVGAPPFGMNSANIYVYNDYGFFLEQSGRFQEAESILLEVLQNSPDRMVAWLNLGDAQKGQGKNKQARLSYNRYVELMQQNGKQSKIPKRVFTFLSPKEPENQGSKNEGSGKQEHKDK